MKSIIYAILVAGMVLISGCMVDDPFENVDNTRFTASEDFAYEIAADGRAKLELSAINGSVEVIAIPDAKTVRVWGEKSVDSESNADAGEHLEELHISLVENADRISVRTQQPENAHGRVYRVNYLVRIPAGWDVSIAMVNGESYMDNLSGETHLELVNGNVVLRNLYGSLVARVTNGSVDAQMALEPDGRSDIRTVNGKILQSVPKLTSATVAASLVTGTISVHNLDLHNVSRSLIAYQGVLGEGKGEIILQTVNGSIELWGE
jgi:hypothetical protein